MRFITEFEQDDTNLDKTTSIIGYRKIQAEDKIGHSIANAFGWKETAQTTQFLNTTIIHKHTIEIEAFPMDKWVEFKNKLFLSIYECEKNNALMSGVKVLELIKELESFVKPAGEAKEGGSK